MLDKILLKLRQMHQALEMLTNPDLTPILPEKIVTENSVSFHLDPSKGITEPELANATTLLINNIACLKDHLRHWCLQNQKAFEGDNLINTNQNIAIIHDLWCVDKHAELNRKPRSGHYPKLQNLKQVLRISAGPTEAGYAGFSINPNTGEPIVRTGVGGSVARVITADIVNEHGVRLGEFNEVCEKAIEAWMQAFVKAGVPLPSM